MYLALNAIRQIWLRRLDDCEKIVNNAADHLTAVISHYYNEIQLSPRQIRSVLRIPGARRKPFLINK